MCSFMILNLLIKKMKCHYIYTENGEKVLIPECWPVVLSGDISQCICRDKKTFADFEREQYNETVKSLRQEIKDLEQENAYLNRIIKKLTKKLNLSIKNK